MQQLDQFDFFPTLADTPGLALVFFSAAACGSCRYWRAMLEKYAAGAAVTLFEVDAGVDQALARTFEVFHLPALFLFIDGEYHSPIHAEARPEALQTAIDRACRLPAEEAP